MVIGIDDYVPESGFDKLKYAGADASELTKALIDRHYKVNHVSEREAFSFAIREKVKNWIALAESSGAETLLFFFSGNGGEDAQTHKQYLMTLDVPAIEREKGVSLNEIQNLLAAARVRDKIMIVDACRDESQAATPSSKGQKGVRPLRAFSQVPEISGFLLLNAASPGKVSYEEDDLKHGVFTHFLLEGLRGKASTHPEDPVTFQDVARYVASNVSDYEAQKNRLQKPTWTIVDRNSSARVVIAEAAAFGKPATAVPPPLPNLISLPSAEVSADPMLLQLHRDRFNAIQQQHAGDALKLADQLVARLPKDSNQFIVRAQIRSILNESKQGLADANAALQLAPESLQARQIRAVHELSLGDWDNATADFAEVVRRQPDTVEAYPGLCYGNLQLQRFDRAVQACSTLLKWYPNDLITLMNRAAAYSRLGQFDNCIQDYSSVIRLQPGNAVAISERGQAYAQMYKMEEAFHDWAEAIRMQPTNPMPYVYRGMLFSFRMQFTEALADVNEAIRLQPANPQHYRTRAGIRQYAGDAAGARSDITMAEELEKAAK